MIDLGNCSLCGHPRADHEDFERCHCGCVRPVLVLSGQAVEAARDSLPEIAFQDWLQAMHLMAETVAA